MDKIHPGTLGDVMHFINMNRFLFYIFSFFTFAFYKKFHYYIYIRKFPNICMKANKCEAFPWKGVFANSY